MYQRSVMLTSFFYMATQLAIHSFVDTVEPRLNKPLFNKDRGISLFSTRPHKNVSFESVLSCINEDFTQYACLVFLVPVTVKYTEKNRDITKPRYSEYILQFLGLIRCIEGPLSLSSLGVCSCQQVGGRFFALVSLKGIFFTF